jgi:AraC-like DNA-binding protein
VNGASCGKNLLCNFNPILEDVAAACGLRDGPCSYFCRVFKRITKTTPAEYRNKVLQQLARNESNS